MKKSIHDLRDEVCRANTRNVISEVRITPEFIGFDVLPMKRTEEDNEKKITQLVSYLQTNFRGVLRVTRTATIIQYVTKHRILIQHTPQLGHNAT